jgi:hypothetical protein
MLLFSPTCSFICTCFSRKRKEACLIINIRGQFNSLYIASISWFGATFILGLRWSSQISERPSWLRSYGGWISNYLYNQCLSSLTLWRGVPGTTLCDKVCQWLATGRWVSPGTPIPSTRKTDCHDITEILFKVAWNTITIKPINLVVML